MSDICVIQAANKLSKIIQPTKLPFNVSKAIFEELSYSPTSACWANSYRTGKWKGRIYIFNYKQQVFPSGCMTRVRKILSQHGYTVEIKDERCKPTNNKNFQLVKNRWDSPNTEFNLRWFQKEAIDKAKKFTRGIFSFPTGAGKTTTFTAIISELKVSPTIVFVPTIDLLYQTKYELEAMLSDENGERIEVGIIGDSKVDIKQITVCIINSALYAYDLYYDTKKDKVLNISDKGSAPSKEDKENITELQKYKDQIKYLIENAKCIICDEVHRSASDMWKSILWKCEKAYYRFGFSATVSRDDGKEMEIEAIFGKVLIEIPLKQMIDESILMNPSIYMVYIYYDPDGMEVIREELIENEETGEKDVKEISQWLPISDWTYQDLYKKLVVENMELNYKIAGFAKEFNSQNLSVLILIKEYAHGEILEELIPNSIFLNGRHSSNKRKQTIQDIKDKKILTLIATSIADMGLDLPTLDCLIMGGSGGSDPTLNKKFEKKKIQVSEKASEWIHGEGIDQEVDDLMEIEDTKSKDDEVRFGGVIEQRLGRVLRKAPGKENAIVVDFWFKNKKMRKQSNARKKIYLNRGLEIKVVK
jgi:superfamily II DNA or RNA helicase